MAADGMGVHIYRMGVHIYHSALGRFLQSDPIIQEPNNPQNFNRYSYVLNNPLSLTDPSGFLFKGIGKFFKKYGRTIAAIGVTLIPGINVIAAGFLAGYISTGTLKGGLIGAFTAGIGDKIAAIQGIDTFGEAFLQGTLGGVGSVLSGGDFGHAFAAAGFSAFASGTEFVKNVRGLESRVAVSAIIGGTASELTGGKFANGAVSGAMQSAIRSIRDAAPVSYDQSDESFDAGPDGDFAKRRAIFDEIVGLRDQLEINIPEGVSIQYDDSFAYVDDNNVFQTCSANCQDIIDQRGTIVGFFKGATITLFRGAVEPGFVVRGSRIGNLGELRASEIKGLERAAKTLGHEAAHARGIDRKLPSSAFHPNAELAGQQALDILKKKYP